VISTGGEERSAIQLGFTKACSTASDDYSEFINYHRHPSLTGMAFFQITVGAPSPVALNHQGVGYANSVQRPDISHRKARYGVKLVRELLYCP
jgi:hypothetical protein